MAISFVGGTSGTGTGASYSVSLSGTLTGGSASSPSPGDLIVVYAGHGATASSAPTCSGNTSGGYVGAHAAQYANDSWDTNFCTFYQFAGTTPDTSLTIGRTNNTTYGGATVVLVFRGVGRVATAATATPGTNSAAVNAPSVTPVLDGAWIVAGGTGLTPSAGTAGMTDISNLTAVVTAYGNGTTADASTIAGYYDGWTSGAFDPATATGGTLGNGSSSWAASSLVLTPRLDSITNDFSSGTISFPWAEYLEGTGASNTITGGKLEQLCGSALGYAHFFTDDGDPAYFRGFHHGRIFARLVQPLQGLEAGGDGFTRMVVFDNQENDTTVAIAWWPSGGVGEIECYYTNAGSYNFVDNDTYDPSTYAWWSIRTDETTVYWDTAPITASNPPQESDWVNFGSVAKSSTGLLFDTVAMTFVSGTVDGFTPSGPAIWDGINTAATTADVSTALTGQSATTSAGTLAPASSAALTGQSATIARGTLSQASSTALTGQSVTSARGTLAPASSKALTGQSATTSTGTLAPASSKALTGDSATTSAGTITASAASSGSADLTGQAVTTSAGALSQASSTALTGQSATSARGTPTPASSKALTGQSATVSRGALTTARTKALTGQSVTSARGTAVPANSKALTGQSVTTSAGTLTAQTSATSALTGQSVTSARGTLTTARTKAITGSGLSVGFGTLSASSSSPFLSGLTQDFTSSTVAFPWATYIEGDASNTITGGQLRQISGTASGYAHYFADDSDPGYFKEFTQGRVFARLVQPLQGVASGVDGFSRLQVFDNQDNDTNLNLVWLSDSTLECYYSAAGVYNWINTIPYVPADHAWFSIRVDATNVYFDVAPATASNPPLEAEWVNIDFCTRAETGFNFNAASMSLVSGADSVGVAPTGPAIWDGLNTATEVLTSAALVGHALAASAGSETVARSTALVGKSLSALGGSISLAADTAQPLTGLSVTASSGTFSNGQSLTGHSTTVARGTLTQQSTTALTGQSAGATAGSLSAPYAHPRFGVNLHTADDLTATERTELADFLAVRNMHHKVRFDLFWDQDQTANRDLANKIISRGGSVQGVLMHAYMWDVNYWGSDLTDVYNGSYDETWGFVNANKDVFQDIELLNEVQLRDEIWAEAEWNAQQESTTAYNAGTMCNRLAAVLKGMADAVRDIRVSSGMPLRSIMGFVGRDWGFATFLQTKGVVWDVTGYHVYPYEDQDLLTVDTWYGNGDTLFERMAAFGKPVTLNEFNGGEIYEVGYENTEGGSLTEFGFASNAKHLRAIYQDARAQCDLETVTVYQLFDEPWKGQPESDFGIIKGLTINDPAKISLLVFTAFAGGALTTADRAELATERSLLTSTEIDSMQVHKQVALTGNSATVSRGTLTATKASIGGLSGQGFFALAGQVAPLAESTSALAGQSVTVARGNVAAGAATSVTVTLTGRSMTTAFGGMTVEATVALVGKVSAFGASTFGSTPFGGDDEQGMAALGGLSMTASAGTIPNLPRAVALSGRSVAVDGGTMTGFKGSIVVVTDMQGHALTMQMDDLGVRMYTANDIHPHPITVPMDVTSVDVPVESGSTTVVPVDTTTVVVPDPGPETEIQE